MRVVSKLTTHEETLLFGCIAPSMCSEAQGVVDITHPTFFSFMSKADGVLEYPGTSVWHMATWHPAMTFPSKLLGRRSAPEYAWPTHRRILHRSLPVAALPATNVSLANFHG